MKPVLMFILKSCPHCQNALRWMEELKKTDEKYNEVEVTIIDEMHQPQLASQYDYYYVPTYYVGEVKVHEGVPTKAIIDTVFKKALSI